VSAWGSCWSTVGRASCFVLSSILAGGGIGVLVGRLSCRQGFLSFDAGGGCVGRSVLWLPPASWSVGWLLVAAGALGVSLVRHVCRVVVLVVAICRQVVLSAGEFQRAFPNLHSPIGGERGVVPCRVLFGPVGRIVAGGCGVLSAECPVSSCVSSCLSCWLRRVVLVVLVVLRLGERVVLRAALG